jgi:hypothetical protein
LVTCCHYLADKWNLEKNSNYHCVVFILSTLLVIFPNLNGNNQKILTKPKGVCSFLSLVPKRRGASQLTPRGIPRS